MTVTIVGLGETGTAIAQLLLNSTRFIRLNIMDPSDKLQGRIIDLSHSGVRNNNTLLFNDRTAFNSSDAIFFCAGTRNLPGVNRESMAQINKVLIEQVFNGITLKDDTVVFVISNPLDAMVSWISHYFGNKKLVIGTGTLLDTWRLRWLLAKRYTIPIEEVSAAVIGEHGDTMVPVWSITKIGEQILSDMLSEDQLNELRLELLSIATKIRATENATKYGVAAVALELFDAFLSTEPRKTIASVPYSEASQKTALKKTLAIGQFVEIGDGKCRTLDTFSELSVDEQKAFEASLKKLDKLVE